MQKIEVSSFDDLIVILKIKGKLYNAHGDMNRSIPGVMATRETARNIVIVDKDTTPVFNWLENIVCKGETLKQYRDQRIAWIIDAMREGEPQPSSPSVSIGADPGSSTGDVSASITVSLPVSSEPPTTTL